MRTTPSPSTRRPSSRTSAPASVRSSADSTPRSSPHATRSRLFRPPTDPASKTDLRGYCHPHVTPAARAPSLPGPPAGSRSRSGSARPTGCRGRRRTRPAASAAAITPLTSSAQVRTVRRTPKWRTIDRVVPVKTGPKNDIAIGIDTRLYVPRSATRRHPQPAILMTHGFGLEKTSNEVVNTARFLAAHGYVVLTYSSSGFGDSGGCVTLQSADYDVKSASQLITAVLSTRRDVKRDRRGVVVGTIGGSYGGGIQLPLAAADRRVRTSVVGRTWNNLLYSLNPNNRVVPGGPTGFSHELNQQGVFKQQWTSLSTPWGTPSPPAARGDAPRRRPRRRTRSRSPEPRVPRLLPGPVPHGLTADLDRRRRRGVTNPRRPGVGLDVHEQDQHPRAAGPGAERHLVQPQRRHRDVHRAQAPPRAGRDDLELRRTRWVRVPARGVRGLRRRCSVGPGDEPLLPAAAVPGLAGPLAARDSRRPRPVVQLLPGLGQVRRAGAQRRAVRHLRPLPVAQEHDHVHPLRQRRPGSPRGDCGGRRDELREPRWGQPRGLLGDLQLQRSGFLSQLQ